MSETAAHEINAETLSADARAVARDLRRPSLTPAAVSTIACLLDAVALGLGLWFAAFATPM
jgi:hypothetical protein